MNSHVIVGTQGLKNMNTKYEQPTSYLCEQ